MTSLERAVFAIGIILLVSMAIRPHVYMRIIIRLITLLFDRANERQLLRERERKK